VKNKFATSLFIFLLVFQSFAQSESLPCVDLNKRQPTTEVENSALVQNLELVNESFHCTLPAVGETRSFSGLLNGVRQDFALKPLSRNTFEVGFNLRFENQMMQERTARCYEQSNDYLRDEMGRNIRFKILSASELSRLEPSNRPQEMLITSNNNTEENAGNFHTDFSCATILHETLHWVGLHDEYHNNRRANYIKRSHTGEIEQIIPWLEVSQMTAQEVRELNQNTEFERQLQYNDCRPNPDTPSIMNSVNAFLADKLPRYVVCPCSGASCDILRERGTATPFGGRSAICNAPGAITTSSAQVYSTLEEIPSLDPSTTAVVALNPTSNEPVLRNAYVEKILYPACASKACRYVTCTQFSYTEAGNACQGRPSYCDTEEYLDNIGNCP
tara:strand:- start:921 stop:2084 length:1164 start_codon:yes stop_codon:yes gene_type:complete